MKFPWRHLLDWYAREGRKGLPWREYTSWKRDKIGYPVWVAEVMLQQTQVERGGRFFTRFLEKFPTIQHLAKATWEEVFPFWDGLGYYSRGRRMIETAKAVVENFDGIFPDTPEQLLTLPGVGPYTARSVAAFAYEKPFLSFDTNLQKIFARYFFGRRDALIPEDLKSQLEAEIQSLKLSGRDINNALMDFGSIASPNDSQKKGIFYPLDGCKFIATQGKLETKKTPLSKATAKKINQKFPLGDAKIAVVLHENGKIFFSPKKSHWEAFLLPPNSQDHRMVIKNWFAKKYGLTLSVRPAFLKNFTKTVSKKTSAITMQATIWYRAQVQAGSVKFTKFQKTDFQIPK